MKNILLIESNDIHAELIQKSLLAGFGKIKITTVDSAQKALATLGKKKFDLILSDYYLPDSKGDGYIKSLIKKAPHIPIVIITGQGDEKIAARTIKAGVVDYIVKTREALEVLPNILQKVFFKFRSQQITKRKEFSKFLAFQKKRAKRILGEVSLIDRRIKILKNGKKKKIWVKEKETNTLDSISQQITTLKKIIKNAFLRTK